MLRAIPDRRSISVATAIGVGLFGLASAMGIGRFSLTPLLPLMQAELGLSIVQGSWLASANYVGYLVGAIICMLASPRPETAMRVGLLWVAITTIPMGVTSNFQAWMLLRFLAGAASAFVLVGVSAWILPQLSQAGKQTWSGLVFSGVGVGIALAGVAVLAGVVFGLTSEEIWLVLGALSVVVVIGVWPIGAEQEQAATSSISPASQISRPAMIAAACYSAFGYAYIIPATYLPSLARVYVPDPLVFGWIWPLFGVAAAISTVIAAPMARTVSPRKLWINSQWLLAIGVLVPTLKVSAPFLLLSAGCAGGSFMVITMAGIREAYRLGQGRETVTIAMMTGCFGIGQIVGPLEVGFFEGSTGSIVLPSLAAAAALTLSNVVLYIQGPGDSREQSNQAQAGR